MFGMEVITMTVSFASFTTIFFFFITLIIIGIIFEKQFLALEDKFDAWVASKRNAEKQLPKNINTVKKSHKAEAVKDSKHHGFAA